VARQVRRQQLGELELLVPVFTALRDAFLDSPWSIPTAA
jgi:hypothetical protein